MEINTASTNVLTKEFVQPNLSSKDSYD